MRARNIGADEQQKLKLFYDDQRMEFDDIVKLQCCIDVKANFSGCVANVDDFEGRLCKRKISICY